MTNLYFLMLLTFLFSGKADNVKITVHPQQVYIEQGKSSNYLNFDFAVQNMTIDTLTIVGIEVSVFDGANKLVLRKFVDENGADPSIDAVVNRVIPKYATTLIYNPFHTFDSDIEIGSMRYTFTFQVNKDQENRFTQQTVVSPKFYQSKTFLTYPLNNRSIVYDGHDANGHHRRFQFTNHYLQGLGIKSNFMRYSYDLCTINEQGDMYKGTGEKNEDWFSFGTAVYASGNGKIIACRDTVEDNKTFNPNDLIKNPLALYGNYIVIDHLNGEFSVFGHLKKGSLKVKVGDIVKQRQEIAAMGNSGSSFMPHLHYELRTGTNLDAEGLPSYFNNYSRVLGSKTVKIKKGQIDTGYIIKNQ